MQHIQEVTICEPPSKLRKISSYRGEFAHAEKSNLRKVEKSQASKPQRSFDILPDEMIMKIFRMVMHYDGKVNKNFRIKSYLSPIAAQTLMCEYCDCKFKFADHNKLMDHVRRRHEEFHRTVMYEYEKCYVTNCYYFCHGEENMRHHHRTTHFRVKDHNYISGMSIRLQS